MPEIAPWLRPADPASHFIQAYHAAGQLAAERARLQHQSQLQAVQMAVRQQEQEQRSLEEQQRMAMEKAYHDQEMGLREQQLAATQERIKQSADIALQRWKQSQAQQQIANAFRERSVAVQEGRLDKALAPPEPLVANPIKDTEGNVVPGMHQYGNRAIQDPGYVGTLAGQRTEKFHATQNRLSMLKAARTQILKDYGTYLGRTTPPANKDLAATVAKARNDLAKIDTEMNQLAPPVGARTPLASAVGRPLPLPKTKADAVAGKVYLTTKGPMLWNGDKFTVPESSAVSDTSHDEEAAPITDEDEEE